MNKTYVVLAVILIGIVVAGVSVWNKGVDPTLVASDSLGTTTVSQSSTTGKVVPVAVEAVPARDTLDLSKQSLSKVPMDIFSKTELVALNVSGNSLAGSLPAEIRLLKKLKVLNLSNNAFTGLPAEIGQLQDLEVLDVSNNQLTGLPHELGNLSHLTQLNLKGNAYSEADLAIIRQSLPAATVVQID